LTVTLVYETHSITEDNESGIVTGWLPGRLSQAGRAQAARLGLRRQNDGLSSVFVSDLARAVETAAIALSGSSIPVRQDERRRECNYGELNGCPVLRIEGDTTVEDRLRRVLAFRRVERRAWQE
jgi:broad specificity phosphatase PhoE